jgi:16S rRNA (guanine1207-N2)-methyltransferase
MPTFMSSHTLPPGAMKREQVNQLADAAILSGQQFYRSSWNIEQATTSMRNEISPYPQEALLIDTAAEMSARRVLCMSPGLAQFAGAVARSLTQAAVHCTYLDLYRANLAAEYWRDGPVNLRIECASDLAEGEADVVAFPFSAGGEAELTRDLLQSGHERLALGGKMYAATDNPNDTWLRDELRKLCHKLERRSYSTGVLYVATKTEPLKKRKNFACEFAFRDRGRLIRVFSRPGVFSHRHIDPGARRLIDAMRFDSGACVLDIGCGSGTVALAAACRADGVAVHAIDSNARAVECTRRGAELNGFTNLMVELNADGNYHGAGQFDVALANPPYYSNFRIARHFLVAGRRALRPGGRILLVTKQTEWYDHHMPQWFNEVTVIERKGYYLLQAVRPPE